MTIEILSPQNNMPNRWLSALVLGCVVFVLTMFCLELIVVSGKISPLWFPTTLMTVVVFRCPSRQLPLLLTACVLGTAGANAIIIGPALANIKFALLNLIQAGVGGMLLRALLDRRAPLNSLHDWARMVVSVGIVTPLLGGLLALWTLQVSGHASFPFFYTWVISEIIGMLVLGPMLLLLPWPLRRAQFSDLRLAESLLTLLLTLGASYLALRFLPWPFTFIVVILFWCAVRLPKLQAFVLFFLNASFISMLLAFDLVNVVNNNSALGPVSRWLPFLLVLIPSHIMSLVMDASRREKLHITDSETRFRHAMEYSAIGMALVAPEGNWLQVNRSLCQTLGYPAEELKRLTFQQITHPDDLSLDLQHVSRLLKGEIDTYTFEKRYFRKDGEIVWARLTVSLVRDSSHAPLYFIAQIIDISELKQSEQVNRRLMERITLANEAGGIGVWEWNLLTGEMLWDKRMYALFGLAPHESPSYDLWIHLLHTADREYAAMTVQQAIELRSAFHMEYRVVNAEGQRWVRTQANRQLSKEGRIERMLGICQDITPLRNLNEALFQEKERMAITLDSIGEAVISTDKEMRVAFMNPVAEKMSGLSQEQAAGQPLSELLHITQGRNGPEVENLLLCQLPAEKITPGLAEDLVLHTPDGGHIDIHYSITPLRSEAGLEQGAVMVIQDVSESRKLMKRLSYSALHDTLTRLPNRASFELQLKRLLFDAAEHQHQHVLVFIDLDKFKAVNDSAGHAAGDALLRELSDLMQHHLRSSDFLARLGGDEFALLMPDCEVAQARDVVQRIVAAVNDYRFQWLGRLYHVGASAGVTQISADNCQSGDVLSQADIACYNAKRSGRGRLVIYEQHRLPLPGNHQGMNAAMVDALQIELPAWAVAPPKTPQAAFIWLLEVQLLTADGLLVDETLLRNNLPDDSLRRRLDNAIVDAFFRHDVQKLNNKGIPVILPLNAQVLSDAAFVQQLCQRFVAEGLCDSRCGLAFPAASVLSKGDQIYAALMQLRQCGCRIVLQHFGRNLDAFNLLSNEVVDYLVLAPELVANVHNNLMDEMLLTIIQGLATQRNISVLAGPISVPAVLSTLATLDVDGVWGSAVAERQPLRSLAEDHIFAIR
ncbi:diguanylate cyclase [Pantoea sp. Bo_2]|uniref:diguanylate cyclase n=1 Tax=Candidatus Pantoea gossypiicola TaxID=2608008 RepID=A0AB34CU68_9GAMM|nr:MULTISPECIES: diguanylate cyclase [Pantoea]KAA5933509.1 diguanylate cyclase [Pantoea sp. VH_8]KAA5938422.1 diguanylate cyclase [Pantoea sp. VH_4]KAA5949738.1 diguanylate cyclase [Pantoea sp. VH_3]KAA5954090.1 diguanylate cyclase [Pantoea sp. VH_25]KAA5984236.1 diguanylate cyclase [Pantoea sp. M_3]